MAVKTIKYIVCDDFILIHPDDFDDMRKTIDMGEQVKFEEDIEDSEFSIITFTPYDYSRYYH